jgi:hypothetical protein
MQYHSVLADSIVFGHLAHLSTLDISVAKQIPYLSFWIAIGRSPKIVFRQFQTVSDSFRQFQTRLFSGLWQEDRVLILSSCQYQKLLPSISFCYSLIVENKKRL